MTYINSKNIKVYPSGYRGLMNIPNRDADDKFSFNPESKLNTEENTVRVYNSLINYENGDFTKSKGSIVITENYKWSTVNKSESNRTFANFEFISNGYYFKIIDSYQEFNDLISEELLKETPQPIYAEICLNSNGVHELRSTNPSSSSTSEINDLNNIYISGNHLGNLRYVNEDITEGNANDNLNNPTTDYSSLDYYDKTTDTYNFTGLTFVTEINSNDSNVLYFKILEPTEDKTDYVVPLTSKLSVDTKHIKGGNDANGDDKSLSTYYETETIESYRNKDLNINARIDSIDPNDSASINETADSNINIKAVKQNKNYKATLQLHKDGNKVNIDAVTTDDINLDSKNSNINADNKVYVKTDTGSEVSLDSNIVEKTNGDYTATVDGDYTNTTKGDLNLSVGNTNKSTVDITQKTGYSEVDIKTGLLDVDVDKQFNLNAQEINLTTDNQTAPSDINLNSNNDISLNSANDITVNALNRISIGNRNSELNNIIFNKTVNQNENTESFDIKAKTDKFTIENNANTPTTTVFEGNEITASGGFLKTNNVYIESYKNNNYAVHTDSDGKLISENISNPGISADNRAVYIQKWNQDSKGHVDITTGDLATVATTGSYNDLINQPHIPVDPVQSNWDEDKESSLAFILNKPVWKSESLSITTGVDDKAVKAAGKSTADIKGCITSIPTSKSFIGILKFYMGADNTEDTGLATYSILVHALSGVEGGWNSDLSSGDEYANAGGNLSGDFAHAVNPSFGACAIIRATNDDKWYMHFKEDITTDKGGVISDITLYYLELWL